MKFEKGEVKLVEVMWLWDRVQPLDSLPPDELCSRKTVLRGLFGLLNGRDFRQFGEAMLYCSNWKGPDHTLGWVGGLSMTRVDEAAEVLSGGNAG